MRLTRRCFLAGSTALTWVAAVPAQGATTSVIGGPAFGSYWRVSVDHDNDLHPIERRISEIVASVNGIFSPYDSRSELSAFNALRTNDWTPVSTPFRTVLDAALRLAATSAGAFDPTVGPIVGRFGFGPIQGAGDAVYRQLAVGTEGIRKETDGITIDLCGIAKGFALDRMRAAMSELEIDNFLIELGGEVISRGRHPDGRPWQVAIDNPIASGTALQHLIALDDKAVATSGVSVNGYEIAGKRYSHIIDAQRRAPIDGDVVSASVLSYSAMEADGLATALVAMQSDAGIAFAERLNLDAAIQLRDGAGLKTVMTGRFAGRLIG